MTEPILKLPLRFIPAKSGRAQLIVDSEDNNCLQVLGPDAARFADEIVRRVNAFDELLAACESALKVVSEIADIDAENRAGWAHKALAEAIDKVKGQL